MTQNLAKLNNIYRKHTSEDELYCSTIVTTMRHILLVLLLSTLGLATHAQGSNHAPLRAALQQVADTTDGRLGIALWQVEAGDTITLGNSQHYPMQSTYKLPLALYILHLADEGKLKLDEPIYIPASTLDTNTWSPMLKDHPNQGFFSLSIQELLAYTIGLSDNNACDILFRQAGGTQPVHKYIHSLGIQDMAIAATEAEMAKGWQVQYTNWCTPMAMAQLLHRLYNGQLLGKASTALLMDMMANSLNSASRIKGMLPPGTPVAHKTGTSNSQASITGAVNDVGIITLPNGKHLIVSVYVSNFTGGTARGEAIIAVVSRLAYNYFSTR
ncbi:MAG: class A beta-lactamase [Sphingobacteriales bacterium]|nr:MAG: class A beta-lactamase [Sphingobacteriales bacterium]